MSTITHTILAEDGPISIEAQPATPGLYAYEAPNTVNVGAPCRWTLGHHSGFAIARFGSPEDAHAAAAAIADLADWTAPAEDIQSAILRRMIEDSPHAWTAWRRLELVKRIEEAGGHFGNCAHADSA